MRPPRVRSIQSPAIQPGATALTRTSGPSAPPSVRIVDRDRRLLEVAGTPVTVLQDARNPAEVAWHENGVRVVVDTTGAGDLYAAGFLFGLTHGYGLARAGRIAGIAAAEAISHMGARPEVPLKDLVKARLG